MNLSLNRNYGYPLISRKMRVCHISHSFKYGGAGISPLELQIVFRRIILMKLILLRYRMTIFRSHLNIFKKSIPVLKSFSDLFIRLFHKLPHNLLKISNLFHYSHLLTSLGLSFMHFDLTSFIYISSSLSL